MRHSASRRLYDGVDAEVVVMNAASAELVKYASNGFLAMKISFANSVAELCEDLGADVRDVLGSVGRDSRIGERFLDPGPGWGGSCFPKDTAALAAIAEDVDRPFSLVRRVDGSERARTSSGSSTRRHVSWAGASKAFASRCGASHSRPTRTTLGCRRRSTSPPARRGEAGDPCV